MPRQITKNLRLFKNSCKLDLSYNGLLNQNEIYNILNEENNDDVYNNNEKLYNPFYNLVENFENIKLIMRQKDVNIFEYLYLNRKKINNILLEEDMDLFIDTNMVKEFSDYYYLYMLIKEFSDLILYKYDFSLIENLCDLFLFSKGTLKKIILAKIAMLLVNNILYGSILFDEKENQKLKEEECEKIKYRCKETINNKKDELKKYMGNEALDEFEIDELYTSILVSLIKNNKLDDSYKTIDLLNEIEIKKIRLNKTIFYGLKNVLTEDYLSKYVISTYDDLFKEDKIVFYYVLFVYILKSSDYIFHIPFLLETRRQIIKLINDNIGYFASDLNNKNGKNNIENINILKQVLEYFIDLNYYIDKSKKKSIKRPIEKPIKRPIEKPIERPIEKPIERPIEKPTKKKLKISIPTIEEELVDYYYPNYYPDSPLSSYYVKEIQEKKLSESLPFQLLANSTFTISVEYKEGKKEAFVNYKKINVSFFENEVYEIEAIKSLNTEDANLNIYYRKFIHFLEMVESELKSNYKLKKKIDIDMKFETGYRREDYNINCDYTIKDDNFVEKKFRDENILNTEFDQLDGITYLVEELTCY